MPDVSGALSGITAKNIARGKKSVAAAVIALAKPVLAQDEDIDVDAVCKIIDAVQGEEIEGDDEIAAPSTVAEDEGGEGEKVAALLNYLKSKLSEEDFAEAARMVQEEEAMDECLDDEKDDGKPGMAAAKDKEKPAMDAATVTRMIAAAEQRGAQRQAQIEQAREDVKPLVGRIIGMDSAEAIYAHALKEAGYTDDALSGARLATLKAMVASETAHRHKPRVAMDAAMPKTARDSYAELYGSK